MPLIQYDTLLDIYNDFVMCDLQIVGINYENYLSDLSDVATEIDDYKSNLFVHS